MLSIDKRFARDEPRGLVRAHERVITDPFAFVGERSSKGWRSRSYTRSGRRVRGATSGDGETVRETSPKVATIAAIPEKRHGATIPNGLEAGARSSCHWRRSRS